jgi:DNA repair protein RadC
MELLEKITLRKDPTDFERVKIGSSKDAADYIRQFYNGDIEIFESFFVLLLNRQNETIGYAKISQGGVTGTYVDTKIILKYVVDTFASGVIIAHNHPSGALTPSAQDDLITSKLKSAITLLDSSLLDHVILTSNNYYSYADNGKI